MKRLSDLSLGMALLIGSAVYCFIAGTPGQGVDITPLFFTVPMALVFITTDLKRIFGKEHTTMEIRNVRGHYEAFLGGKFICSGDTRSECAEAAEEYYSDDAA